MNFKIVFLIPVLLSALEIVGTWTIHKDDAKFSSLMNKRKSKLNHTPMDNNKKRESHYPDHGSKIDGINEKKESETSHHKAAPSIKQHSHVNENHEKKRRSHLPARNSAKYHQGKAAFNLEERKLDRLPTFISKRFKNPPLAEKNTIYNAKRDEWKSGKTTALRRRRMDVNERKAEKEYNLATERSNENAFSVSSTEVVITLKENSSGLSSDLSVGETTTEEIPEPPEYAFRTDDETDIRADNQAKSIPGSEDFNLDDVSRIMKISRKLFNDTETELESQVDDMQLSTEVVEGSEQPDVEVQTEREEYDSDQGPQVIDHTSQRVEEGTPGYRSLNRRKKSEDSTRPSMQHRLQMPSKEIRDHSNKMMQVTIREESPQNGNTFTRQTVQRSVKFVRKERQSSPSLTETLNISGNATNDDKTNTSVRTPNEMQPEQHLNSTTQEAITNALITNGLEVGLRQPPNPVAIEMSERQVFGKVSDQPKSAAMDSDENSEPLRHNEIISPQNAVFKRLVDAPPVALLVHIEREVPLTSETERAVLASNATGSTQEGVIPDQQQFVTAGILKDNSAHSTAHALAGEEPFQPHESAAVAPNGKEANSDIAGENQGVMQEQFKSETAIAPGTEMPAAEQLQQTDANIAQPRQNIEQPPAGTNDVMLDQSKSATAIVPGTELIVEQLQQRDANIVQSREISEQPAGDSTTKELSNQIQDSAYQPEIAPYRQEAAAYQPRITYYQKKAAYQPEITNYQQANAGRQPEAVYETKPGFFSSNSGPLEMREKNDYLQRNITEQLYRKIFSNFSDGQIPPNNSNQDIKVDFGNGGRESFKTREHSPDMIKIDIQIPTNLLKDIQNRGKLGDSKHKRESPENSISQLRNVDENKLNMAYLYEVNNKANNDAKPRLAKDLLGLKREVRSKRGYKYEFKGDSNAVPGYFFQSDSKIKLSPIRSSISGNFMNYMRKRQLHPQENVPLKTSVRVKKPITRDLYNVKKYRAVDENAILANVNNITKDLNLILMGLRNLSEGTGSANRTRLLPTTVNVTPQQFASSQQTPTGVAPQQFASSQQTPIGVTPQQIISSQQTPTAVTPQQITSSQQTPTGVTPQQFVSSEQISNVTETTMETSSYLQNTSIAGPQIAMNATLTPVGNETMNSSSEESANPVISETTSGESPENATQNASTENYISQNLMRHNLSSGRHPIEEAVIKANAEAIAANLKLILVGLKNLSSLNAAEKSSLSSLNDAIKTALESKGGNGSSTDNMIEEKNGTKSQKEEPVVELNLKIAYGNYDNKSLSTSELENAASFNAANATLAPGSIDQKKLKMVVAKLAQLANQVVKDENGKVDKKKAMKAYSKVLPRILSKLVKARPDYFVKISVAND